MSAVQRLHISPDELAFYRTHVAAAVREDGVVCLECGALCWRVGKHVATHGLTLGTYRAKWGYRPNDRLAVPPSAEWAARWRKASRREPRTTVSPQELAYYRTHIREAVSADGVVCLECGTVYKFIGVHVLKHGLTGADYREKWGYNRGSALVSPGLHARKRQIALARDFGSMSPPDAILKAKEAQREHPPAPARTERRLNQRDDFVARAALGVAPRRPKKVSDEVLRALVADGHTFQEIAARTGLAYANARGRIRSLGLAGAGIPSWPRRGPGVTDAELLALRASGLWNREMAERLGLSRAAVSNRLAKLRRQGVPIPVPPTPPPNAARRVEDEQILSLVREGLRPGAIAERVALGYDAVRFRLASLRRRGLLPPVAG